jgi:hypothetical protein
MNQNYDCRHESGSIEKAKEIGTRPATGRKRKIMSSHVIAALGAVLLVGIGTTSADAAPITYRYSGVLDLVEDPASALLGSGVELGTAFTGTVTWDPNTPSTGTFPFEGGTISAYPVNSVFRISALLGGVLNLDTATATATVSDDTDNRDLFEMSSGNFLVFDAPNLGAGSIFFSAYDFSGAVFSTSASLPMSLDLSAFDPVRFAFASYDGMGSYYFAQGDIRFLSLHSPVSEPGTLALLCLGTASLGLCRRRKGARQGRT